MAFDKNKPVVVSIKNVSKTFELPHQRKYTIKSAFTGIFQSRSKQIQHQHALKNINIDIHEGEFFGIVGRNGSGKSTLLKMIAGIYQPTHGKITQQGKLVPFIELGVGFNPELSGRDNVYLNGAILGFSRQEIDKRYERIVKFAELEDFMDQKLKNYSSGMQVRLAFSCATMAKADILLVDEVLAVGDADFQRKCFNYFKKLKKEKKTVIFVSHDMNAVRDYCDRAALIEDSQLIMIDSAQKVSNEYTKLFMPEQYVEEQDASDEEERVTRYGSGKIKIIKIDMDRVVKGSDVINLSIVLQSTEDVENPRVGYSLKDSFLRPLTGTNTKLLGQNLGILKAGKQYTMSFEVPNVFNKGDYTFDIAIESESADEVYDWWEEAVNFRIDKSLPPVFIVDLQSKISKPKVLAK